MTSNEEPAEPPPPYQEQPEQQNLTNNNATATAQPTAAQPPPGGEAKPVRQNEPPPDGEGEFGAPLKRLMWIGGVLLFYCILAFWYPVYYMDRMANYCEKVYGCDQYNDDSLNSLCHTLCDEDIETRGIKVDQLLAAFSLWTIGVGLMAVGVVLGYFGVKQGNRLYCQITAGLLGLGGLFCIIGVILFIAVPEDPEEAALAALIVIFVEAAIPSSIAILLAYDVYNPLFLNVERNRWLYCTSAIFLVFGFMGGVLYAYIANYEACEPSGLITICYESAFKDEYGCIAAGFFIVAIISLIRILIFEGKINIDNPANMVTAKLAVAVLIVVGAFILAVGYWAGLDSLYENATADDEDQHKCYAIGFTLFMLGIAIVNSVDMGIVALWKACQAAQATANAANSAAPATDGNAAATAAT